MTEWKLFTGDTPHVSTAWAWDLQGYAGMIAAAGWQIVRHEQAGLFQVVLAR